MFKKSKEKTNQKYVHVIPNFLRLRELHDLYLFPKLICFYFVSKKLAHNIMFVFGFKTNMYVSSP